jgi:hypothetical protein
MRLFRGYALAAVLLCASITPSIAAAASPGVGVVHDVRSDRIANADAMLNQIDTILLVSPSPARAKVAEHFGRTQMPMHRVSNLMLTNRGFTLRAPLAVGAIKSGSALTPG